MKFKMGFFISCFCLAAPSWADVNLATLLNKVTLQVSAKQWITTSSALVNVLINAAVTDQAVEQVQNSVMQKLNQFAKADWHVLSFNRSQDNSGLEKIQIMAQARLQQSELGNLRNKAKEMSKPGETYSIDSVEFTPSDEEVRDANTRLRTDIYAQVKAEIDNLNKQYTDQKFYIHQIDFTPGNVMPMQANQMYLMKEASVAGAAPAPKPINVGNKVELQAQAVIASMPVQVSQQLPH